MIRKLILTLILITGCQRSLADQLFVDELANAKAGDAASQTVVAELYMQGQGVPQDIKRAYVWSSLAATSGETNAVNNRDIAASNLTPATLEKAQQEAAALMQKIDQSKAK